MLIDNKRCKKTIRPFVVASLFSNTPASANASTIAYFLVDTAKANGVDHKHGCTILENLPAAKTADKIDKLLP